MDRHLPSRKVKRFAPNAHPMHLPGNLEDPKVLSVPSGVLSLVGMIHPGPSLSCITLCVPSSGPVYDVSVKFIASSVSFAFLILPQVLQVVLPPRSRREI